MNRAQCENPGTSLGGNGDLLVNPLRPDQPQGNGRLSYGRMDVRCMPILANATNGAAGLPGWSRTRLDRNEGVELGPTSGQDQGVV